MPKIKIDGKEYEAEKLSAETRNQIANLRIVDREIQQLQAKIAIAKTARNAYANALSALLPKDADAAKLN